jgi:hypothetical protein
VKVCRGSKENLHSFLTLTLDQGEWSRPLLPPPLPSHGERTPVPIGLGGPQRGSGPFVGPAGVREIRTRGGGGGEFILSLCDRQQGRVSARTGLMAVCTCGVPVVDSTNKARDACRGQVPILLFLLTHFYLLIRCDV